MTSAEAWCLDRQGRVIELTWPEPGEGYYGVPFKTTFLMRQLRQARCYGLIDSADSQFAIARGRIARRQWRNERAMKVNA